MAAERDERLWRVYMNDQLAAAVLWRELARRSLSQNRKDELGGLLQRLAAELTEDVVAWEKAMERLGVGRDRLKAPLAIAAERLGRLKPNGRLRGYSPLSRVLELDGLAVGLASRRIAWLNVRERLGAGTASGADPDRRLARIEELRADLEPLRAGAAATALA